MLLPIHILFVIGGYLPWYDRVQPITKGWLDHFLKTRIRLTQWKSKRLLFTYMNMHLIDENWEQFAKQQLGLKRRLRNSNITWQTDVKVVAIKHGLLFLEYFFV